MRGRLLPDCIDDSLIGSASVLEDLDLNFKKSPSDVINPIHGGNDDVQVSGRSVDYVSFGGNKCQVPVGLVVCARECLHSNLQSL